jgi:hypothetical protein
MKRRLLTLSAVALSAGMSIMPICAEGEAPADSGETQITMYEAEDPSYTITIPSAVALDTKKNTQVPVTASGVKNLPEGKKISVTFAKGSGTYGRLYLEGKNPNGGNNYLMTLMISGTSKDFKCGALENQIVGMELASFTADGTEDFEMYPCAFDYPDANTDNLKIQKGVNYTGSMTYGIQVTDIQ